MAGKWTRVKAIEIPRADPSRVLPGDWLRHGPTSTWFEVEDIVEGPSGEALAIGADIHDRWSGWPVDECTPGWIPELMSFGR